MGRCGAELREGAVGRAWTAVNKDSGAPWGHFSASPLWSPPEISQALLDPVLTAVSGGALAGMMIPMLCLGKTCRASAFPSARWLQDRICKFIFLKLYLITLGLSCSTRDL